MKTKQSKQTKQETTDIASKQSAVIPNGNAQAEPGRAIKPPTGTKEWADVNVNIISGCSHDCHYCFAKSDAVQHRRRTPADWHEERLRENGKEKR
jgi:DNA repair photolyase